MKNISKIMAILGLSSVMTMVSMADTPIKVVYNEKSIKLESDAIITQDRLLIPLREISEILGYKVKWNNKEKEITLYNEETHVKMQISSLVAHVNNKQVTLDVPAQIIEGVTYVPTRFITEAFGKEVSWNKAENKLNINDKMAYFIDLETKELILKEDGELKTLGNVRIIEEGSIDIQVVDIASNSQIITVDNVYSGSKDKTTLYMRDGEVIKSVQATYKKEIEETRTFDDRVSLSDGKKVYVYNQKDGELTAQYDLGKILGTGNYVVEAVGANFVLVREEQKGILTLVKKDNSKGIEIYKEILPNEEEKRYIAGMKEPRHDGIRLLKKEGNTFHFTYSGLEIKDGKFAYYMKK